MKPLQVYEFTFKIEFMMNRELNSSIILGYLGHVLAQAGKNKKKNTLKNFIIFFQKKVFLIFWGMNFLAQGLKSSYVFSKKTFSYISGGNFQSLKNKKKSTLIRFLIFLQKKISSHDLG